MNTKESPNDAAMPRELEKWLDGMAPEDKSALERTWEYAAYAQVNPPPQEEVQQAVATFQEAVNQESSSRKTFAGDRPSRQRTRFFTPARRVFAGVLLVMICFAAWWTLSPVVINVPAGQLATVSLPDGSDVLMNSGSEIRYRRGLAGTTRKVILEGEAYFDVAKDTKPFIVETFNAEVTVLGTEFNVRSWTHVPNPQTEVMLDEGQVSFNAKLDPATAVLLKPGQMSRVVGVEAVPVQPFDFLKSMELVWRDGGISFIDKSVASILAGVEKKYGIQIENDQVISESDTLTFFIPHRVDAEEVLRDFCSYMGCSFEATPTGYQLR